MGMYIRNRVDTSPSPVSWSKMCKYLFGYIGFMLFMFYLGEKFPASQPVAPKQYPYNNLYLERGGDPEKQPEEGIIIELPANSDKLSAVPWEKKKHSFQHTNSYMLR